LESTELAMLLAAGVALIGTVAAIGMAALQALANPSGTVVTSVSVIVASGLAGTVGLAAFGILWLLRNNKRS
jgi:hypothetical protein